MQAEEAKGDPTLVPGCLLTSGIAAQFLKSEALFWSKFLPEYMRLRHESTTRGGDGQRAVSRILETDHMSVQSTSHSIKNRGSYQFMRQLGFLLTILPSGGREEKLKH